MKKSWAEMLRSE